MNETIVSALTDETVVHANALATVTRNCVVVRDETLGGEAVIAMEQLTAMRKVTSTNPGLLAISCGLFTIAAAAYASGQDSQISLPIGAAGVMFVMGYIGTKRASVLFVIGGEQIESVKGSFREATSIIRAVNRTRGGDLEVRVIERPLL